MSLMHISLDGFAAGPNGEMDLIVYDGEIFKDAIALTESTDTAIYGRTTYQMMVGYWPTVPSNPDSSPDDIHHAQWVENVHKVVISRSLDKVEWNNTQLIGENVAEEIRKLKAQPGQNLMIFGSPHVVHLLGQLGLVDEYRLNVSPVVLGEGIPMFEGIKTKLKLLNAKTFDSGVVALHYATVR
jgi:dihydrofolate reductase